jgi:hypothetical protein
VTAIDVQEAFRRGTRGRPLGRDAANGLAEEPEPFAAGPNEAVLLSLGRLPGLKDVQAAYETGRALRMIVQLFDRAGAPERIGRQFIDNLAGAVVVDHMRHGLRPWSAMDTVDMFVEMYARILGGGPSDLDPIRRAVMDYAVAPQGNGTAGAESLPWFRRRAGAIARRRSETG